MYGDRVVDGVQDASYPLCSVFIQFVRLLSHLRQLPRGNYRIYFLTMLWCNVTGPFAFGAGGKREKW